MVPVSSLSRLASATSAYRVGIVLYTQWRPGAESRQTSGNFLQILKISNVPENSRSGCCPTLSDSFTREMEVKWLYNLLNTSCDIYWEIRGHGVHHLRQKSCFSSCKGIKAVLVVKVPRCSLVCLFYVQTRKGLFNICLRVFGWSLNHSIWVYQGKEI